MKVTFFAEISHMLVSFQNWIQGLALPGTLIVGVVLLLAFYAGRGIKHLRMPAIIGFMLTGVLLGPSLLNIVNDGLRHQLDFVTQIALGTVAMGIGLELSYNSIWRKGPGIVILIVSEVLLTFVVVVAGIYILSGNIVLALMLGAVSTATAPAGTIAVIQETGARGPLAKALYAIVGLDDALGVLVFGFALAIARGVLASGMGEQAGHPALAALVYPVVEVILSLIFGILIGLTLCFLLRAQSDRHSLLIQTVAVTMIAIGLSRIFPLSMIFTVLVAGSVVVNTQPAGLVERLRGELTGFMPLLYVLFFALAGANLHLGALSQIWLLGLAYIICRSAGKVGGTWLGAVWGKLGGNLRKYTGMAVHSQAGLAIGLALIVKSKLSDYGPAGADTGTTVLAVVTATCIFFELIGPILVAVALNKAGEIPVRKHG